MRIYNGKQEKIMEYRISYSKARINKKSILSYEKVQIARTTRNIKKKRTKGDFHFELEENVKINNLCLSLEKNLEINYLKNILDNLNS